VARDYSFLPVILPVFLPARNKPIAIVTIPHTVPSSLPSLSLPATAAALGRSVAAATEHIPRSLQNEAAAAVIIT
jgi:hypothetical protein